MHSIFNSTVYIKIIDVTTFRSLWDHHQGIYT